MTSSAARASAGSEQFVRVKGFQEPIGNSGDYGEQFTQSPIECRRLTNDNANNATIAAPSAPASYSASYATISCQAGGGGDIVFQKFQSLRSHFSWGDAVRLCQRRTAREAAKRKES